MLLSVSMKGRKDALEGIAGLVVMAKQVFALWNFDSSRCQITRAQNLALRLDLFRRRARVQ